MSESIKIKISQQGGFFNGKAAQIINDALVSAITEVTTFLEREVKERTPVGYHGNRGAGLKNSIYSEVEKGSKYIKGIVAHSSKYGDVIEKGRKPGKKMPPVSKRKKGKILKEGPLIDWMVFKFQGIDREEAYDIEWGVARNIAKFGTEGAHMFENAYKENETTIEKIFQDAGFNIAVKFGDSA